MYTDEQWETVKDATTPTTTKTDFTSALQALAEEHNIILSGTVKITDASLLRNPVQEVVVSDFINHHTGRDLSGPFLKMEFAQDPEEAVEGPDGRTFHIGDPVRIGVTKVPNDFKSLLNDVKIKTPGATFET